MKQKRTLKRETALLLAAFIAAGIGGFFILHGNSPMSMDTETQLDANTIGQSKSPFSFNADATNGWYMGPANETSLAVFGKSSKSEQATETYFAYIYLKDDGVGEAEWLQELNSKNHSDYTFVSDQVLAATLHTNDGPINYELRTYANQLKEGRVKSQHGLNDMEVHGYIPYGNQYFLVHGYATPGNLLPEVIQAIQAFSFKGTN